MPSDKFRSMVSLVLNPAVVAAFTFVILLYPLLRIQTFRSLAISITFGSLVPIATMHQLSKRGMISDFLVSEKGERTKPFAGAIASYVVGSAVLLLTVASCYGTPVALN